MTKKIYYKIKKILSALNHPLFSYLKIKTHGYLSPVTYYHMYLTAKQAPVGNIIDIGPAQGGSTIAYAMGLKEKNVDNQYKVYSIEKGIGSRALSNSEDHTQNTNVLNKNIKDYNLSEQVEVIMKYSHEAFADRAIPNPITVLSIDADGALDRDFKIFYNNVVAGGKITIDDYENIINEISQKWLKMSLDELDKIKKTRNVSRLSQINCLGKEYTTHKFVEYFIANKFLSVDFISGRNTLFATKPANAPTFTDTNFQEMQQIRQEMEEKFWSMHKELHNY